MLAGIEPFLRFALLCIGAFWVIAGAFIAGSFLDGTVRHLIGYAGTFLILVAQVYFLRKKYPSLAWLGPVRVWMKRHEVLTLIGSALVVVHAGGNGMPSGLAMVSIILMLVTAISGMVGAYIHQNAIRARGEMRAELRKQGRSPAEIDEELYLVTLSESAFREWKRVHQPITWGFLVTMVFHIFFMILFGGAVKGV